MSYQESHIFNSKFKLVSKRSLSFTHMFKVHMLCNITLKLSIKALVFIFKNLLKEYYIFCFKLITNNLSDFSLSCIYLHGERFHANMGGHLGHVHMGCHVTNRSSNCPYSCFVHPFFPGSSLFFV